MMNYVKHIKYPTSKNFYKLHNTFITPEVKMYQNSKAFHVFDYPTIEGENQLVNKSSGQRIAMNGSDQ